MNPHYYLMKNKKILRLEAEVTFESLCSSIREMVFDKMEIMILDQEQANWRVVIFRDEIMELEEFNEWLATNPIFQEEGEEEELDLIAN